MITDSGQSHPSPTHADSASARTYLSELWQRKWQVVVVTGAFTAAAAASAQFLVKEYTAEIVVTPVSDSSSGIGGSLSGIASQYGEIASLAGISMSGKGNKEEAIAVLKSELITEAYIRQQDLLPKLYAKRWNAEQRKWNPDEKVPTPWTGAQLFKKSIRQVKEDRQSGIVTMRITWRDPAAAAQWANDLVKITNNYLRDKAIKESDRNMAYLNEQAAKTSVIEARTVIFSIFKDELNKQMIAKGRDEYALRVLDPAQIPEVSATPSPALLTLIGFVAGLLVSSLLVWAVRARRI